MEDLEFAEMVKASIRLDGERETMAQKQKRAVQNKIRRLYYATTGKRLPLLLSLDDLLCCVDEIISHTDTLREETLCMLDM